jgi:hypothetical protein
MFNPHITHPIYPPYPPPPLHHSTVTVMLFLQPVVHFLAGAIPVCFTFNIYYLHLSISPISHITHLHIFLTLILPISYYLLLLIPTHW